MRSVWFRALTTAIVGSIAFVASWPGGNQRQPNLNQSIPFRLARSRTQLLCRRGNVPLFPVIANPNPTPPVRRAAGVVDAIERLEHLFL